MSKKADAYNQAELVAGRLTPAHITALVEHFQHEWSTRETSLTIDGFFGPKTREALEALMQVDPILTWKFAQWPLPPLPDGRRPIITSSFKPKDRPNHVGVDMFYAWVKGDKPDFVGDKGCAGKRPDGKPKYVIPYGTYNEAVDEGVVQIAGNSATGYRCWIDHGNGLRTGYFHMLDLAVNVGDIVEPGEQLGLVGDNPKDHDGRHLHFELSPVDRYAPIDPAPYLP